MKRPLFYSHMELEVNENDREMVRSTKLSFTVPALTLTTERS